MRSQLAAAGTIVALPAVVVTVLIVGGLRPTVALVGALGVMCGTGLWFLFETLERVDTRVVFAVGRAVAPDARVDRRVTRLRSGLAHGRADGASFELVRARLVDVIADQLRWTHDLDLVVDQTACRVVLGDRLSSFVDDPTSAADLADPAELDRILTLIERI